MSINRARKLIFIILFLLSFAFTEFAQDFFIDKIKASFAQIVALFVKVSPGFTQVSYRFFTPHETLDPWDPWSSGSALDLAENGYINPMAFPPLSGQIFRLRIGIKSPELVLASVRKFKLQFGKLASGQSNCSATITWNDLGDPGSSADWRGFDMLQATLINDAFITINRLNSAELKGTYQERALTGLNPLWSANQIVEYDWSIQNNINNNSSDGGFYCFRMVNENGSTLNQYLQYPKVATTKPFINSTSSTIDRNFGGTINMSNTNGTGFTFIIPANYSAFSQSFDIHNLAVNDFLDQVGGQPSGKLGAHSYIYQLNAERNNIATSSFDENLTMRIDYLDNEVGSVDESTLRIYKHDGNSWNAQNTTLDTTNNRATTAVNSFSSFGLFGDPTPTSTPTPIPASGGGGGGGGGGGYVQTAPLASVVIKGRSYPNSTISFLKDAQLISKTKADKQGNFEISESGLSGGSYNFSLWALDELNLRSNTYSFFLNIIANSTNNVLGILMPPTIALNKTTINPGEQIRVYGSSVPDSFVIIEVRSEPTILSTKASNKGLYSQEVSSAKLAKGTHTVKSKSKIGTGDESIFSSLLSFGIGVPAKKALIGDLNKDGKVNIIDFSILAFWYKRTGFPAEFDLKQDGKIDLKDFSIMAFYWTG